MSAYENVPIETKDATIPENGRKVKVEETDFSQLTGDDISELKDALARNMAHRLDDKVGERLTESVRAEYIHNARTLRKIGPRFEGQVKFWMRNL